MTRLSTQSILATLAALGTTALVGCGGSEPAAKSPVDAKEHPGATPTADGKGQGSCSAAGCGAHHGDKTEEKSGGLAADAPKTDTKATEAPKADAKPADAKAATDAKPTDAKAADPKAAAKPAAKKGAPAGAAGGCGAGTCSAKK
jgi:hypothetical protein